MATSCCRIRGLATRMQNAIKIEAPRDHRRLDTLYPLIQCNKNSRNVLIVFLRRFSKISLNRGAFLSIKKKKKTEAR